jgi:hypothetical protein
MAARWLPESVASVMTPIVPRLVALVVGAVVVAPLSGCAAIIIADAERPR